jgi:hypothetical protein
MLLPLWKTRLEAAAEDGRELRIQTRKHKAVLVAVKPNANQMEVLEFPSTNEYMKFADEIDQFFESKRKD